MTEYTPIPLNRSLLVLETPIKEQRNEKYEILSRLIENVGEWNINISALSKSKDLAMPRSTLQKWKDKIVAERGPIDISKVGNQIQMNMISNINMMQKTIHSAKSVHEKQQAIRAYNETIKTFTDFLEAYGYKRKVADKLDINSQIIELSFKQEFEEFQKLDKNKH